MASWFSSPFRTSQADAAFKACSSDGKQLTHDELVRAVDQVLGANAIFPARLKYLVSKRTSSPRIDLPAFKELLTYTFYGHRVKDELHDVWGMVEDLQRQLADKGGAETPEAVVLDLDTQAAEEMRTKLGVIDEWIAKENHKHDIRLISYHNGELLDEATASDWTHKSKGQTSNAIFRASVGLGRYYGDSDERLLLQHFNTMSRPATSRDSAGLAGCAVWALALTAAEYTSLAAKAPRPAGEMRRAHRPAAMAASTRSRGC